MTAQFVVRLLDAADQLLSWAKISADAKPQERGGSCPFFAGPTLFVIEQDGVVAKLTVHWADLDVARVKELPPTPVKMGQVFTFVWTEPIWLVAGSRDVPLPPVTVRGTVAVAPPEAAIGARAPL